MGARMTDSAAHPTREQLRLEGFELIDERLHYLLACLADALEITGETELLPYLPWSGSEPEIGAAPEGLPQLYSIGVQLLNMVEERVAAEIRREREKALGAESIRGLWPQALRDLRAMDLGPEEILGVLADERANTLWALLISQSPRAEYRLRNDGSGNVPSSAE